MKELTEYEKQANAFLNKTDSTISVKFLRTGIHFEGEKEKRDIYLVTISKDNKHYDFNFGQSIALSVYYVNRHLKGRKYDCNGFLEGSPTRKQYPNIENVDSVDKRPGTKPSAYDILSCLTKYDPETFEDFCSNFGYDTDSRKAEGIYNSVVKEYKELKKLYSADELALMAKIQ